jgi:single-stranded DNA-binding protein
VRGRLEIGEWTTRDGEQRTSYDIWADDVVNLTPREGSTREDAPRDEPRAAPVGASAPPARQEAAAREEDLEDLPF